MTVWLKSYLSPAGSVKKTHLLTISNAAQGPFHITPAVWYEGENEGGKCCENTEQDLRWIDSDYRILSLSRLRRRHTNLAPPLCKSAEIFTIFKRTEEIYYSGLAFNAVGEKKKTSCSQPEGFLRYYFFRRHGSDNIIATEQSCNIR